MSDEDFHRDAAALSHIASKMPTPPPRPPSIASSTRSSSKRSSAASSLYRQSRHTSLAGELEAGEAPPTPKLSSRYTSATTLGDEMSQMAEGIGPSSSFTSFDRPTSNANSPRLNRARSGSSGISLSGRRKSTRGVKERDRESSNMSTATAFSPPSSPRLCLKTSRASVLQKENASNLQLESSSLVGLSGGTLGVNVDAQHFPSALETFILDVLRAYSAIWSLVVWPLMLAMFDSFTELTQSSSSPIAKQATPGSVGTSAQTIEIERSFAERFKYLVCTSSLLTKNLSISSYDQTPSPTVAKDVTDLSPIANQSNPSSTIAPCEVSACSSETRHSTFHFNEIGRLLSNATCVAIFVLGPLTRSQQVWFESAVFLVSLVLGFIATFGLDRGMELSFEISHQATGTYSLSAYDAKIGRERHGDVISASKASSIKDGMCAQVTDLVKSCKGFDVECNKVIAAVQEVELISRGFKLSHPLPPISRIEANSMKISSPPRMRNGSCGSWQSPASVFNTVRLSRSSSSGASAASGSKHHGQQPQSILPSNESIILEGRSSPQKAGTESLRLVSLRRGLVMCFDDARKSLENAIERLDPLIDKNEMELLQEMYELDSNLKDDHTTLVPLTASSGKATTEKRSSWIHNTRQRLEDERPYSPNFDEGDRPATPQRMHAFYDGSARRRDSGISETWSAASPSREAHPIRSGSRLGYVSDKTGVNGTPNQNAESKRLSYINSSPNVITPGHTKSFSLQQSSPAMGGHSANKKRASLLGSGILDDLKHTTSTTPNSNGQSKMDAFLIVSLKSSFDKIHALRRRVLCQLLALEFTFKKESFAKKGSYLSAKQYWASVSKVMKGLAGTMSRLAVECSRSLEKEISLGEGDGLFAKKQDDASRQILASIENLASSPHQDFTGMEDRLTAMGLALRSIQIKMLLCAQELKVRSPPTLHGTSTTASTDPLPGNDVKTLLRNEKPESVLETIREDLLTLSAEWESALKIAKIQRSPTPTSAIGDTTASTLNSSRLDSPQEAEEDALRQWVQARRGADESSDSEDERVVTRIMETGLLQWSGLDSNKDDGWQDHSDLSELLVKTASPEHLPPPGLEKIYESMGSTFEAKRQKSGLSREERIRLAKEERAAIKENVSKTDSMSIDASTGIIQELQAVMKNRKSFVGEAVGGGTAIRDFKGIDTSNTFHEGGNFNEIPAAAKRAPFAF